MIELSEVHKTYPGGAEAVRGVSLTVPQGALCVLIGPSGCGKTTLLRLINKLLPLSGGAIRVAGRDIAGEDAVSLRRRIGYAIQQVGLFPHMTVGENIAVVPALEGWERRRIQERVAELMSLTGLPPGYAARYPRELSGGEAQRVGVARALAADPPVMLMDEPFGALDPVTRERLQDEFLAIQGRLHKTVLVVSHDMDEALRMGDRIAIMRDGRLEQEGTPAEILLHPATPFVREFLGVERAFAQLARLPVTMALDAKWAAAAEPAGLSFAGNTPVKEALLAMAAGNVRAARVTGEGERSGGVVTLRSIAALLGSGRKGPPERPAAAAGEKSAGAESE
ncbi:MAG: ABC transporter ATP-binding protein [SAR324 cluster bacterium]|nr:ABC transporter ATP-binding protein [SAR324 cluster bacterium]